MSTQTLLLIAGMMLVTYLPRALPAAFLENSPRRAGQTLFRDDPLHGHGGADLPRHSLLADPQHWYVGLLGRWHGGAAGRKKGAGSAVCAGCRGRGAGV